MMSDLSAAISDDGRKLLDTCIGVVFSGVTIGLETEDEKKETAFVQTMWPAALDLSGYQIAKECVLAIAAVAGVSNEQLAAMALATMERVPKD